jgi:transposase-like protein
MASNLSAPHFINEDAALAYVEAWLWPDGPVCPFCGETKRVGRLSGKTTRAGLCKCYACQKPFTVKMGSVFESTHAPLRLWLQAIYLICSSKKGISTRQLQRTLGVGMKTAWHMGHRIRAMMAPAADAAPLGGPGQIIEADETYILTAADAPRAKKRYGGAGHKMKIMSLTERGGKIRSKRIKEATKLTARDVLRANVDPQSILHTDGSQIYVGLGATKEHEFVDHQISYVGIGRKGRKVHTNTLEGFFSVFKRGMVGVYQHCEEQHLNRYLAEFDFRQNNRIKLGIDDVTRSTICLQGAKGKRLTYRTINKAGHA